MPEPTTDPQLDEFLEIRKPGAHLTEDVVPDDFVLMLGVDLHNFPKFPRVDDGVTYAKADLDIRQQVDVDSGAELPDYSGPWRADLRYTDFSRDALASRFLPWSEAYLVLCVDGWAAEVARRYGDATIGRDRVGRVARPGRPGARAHARRVPPGRIRCTSIRTRPWPRRTGPPRASCTPGSSARRRPSPTSTSPSSSAGCSGRTSTCSSASRRGRPRSSCATAST